MGTYCSKEELLTQLKKIRAQSQVKVVFTNGCFDLLHLGHVSYLQEARKLGDFLVVALNTDASVKRLKGPSRPIQTQDDRAKILAALGCVDFTVLFDEDTPFEIIKSVEPDVLVKGGDWKPEQIVGSDLVLARGGRVLSLSYIPGKSTTQLISKF